MDWTRANCRRNECESKENLRFDDQSKQFVFFFFLEIFRKEIEQVLGVPIELKKHISESLGELEKGVYTHLSACVPTAISRSRYLI